MTLTTERQQFEQWWETAMHNGSPPRFGWEHWRDGEGYRDDDGEFQGLWQAWQASRELLAKQGGRSRYHRLTKSQPAPAVPPEITDGHQEDVAMGGKWADSFRAGWNACRDEMLELNKGDL